MISKHILLYLYSCINFFDSILGPCIDDDDINKDDDNNDNDLNADKEGKERSVTSVFVRCQTL